MHSWRENVKLLEEVGMPGVVGYQADMAHSMLFVLGANAEKDRLLPNDFDWADKAALDAAYNKVADALRPWTLDFHVAQNDGTTFGSGDHAITGRHCQVDDPNGRLDVTKHAGYWLRDDNGNLTKTHAPHLLGRLHVPQRGDGAAGDLEQGAGRRWSRCATRTAGASRRADAMTAKQTQHRHGGLRLHGPRPLQRLGQRRALLRHRLSPGAEGGRGAQCLKAPALRRACGATSASRATGAR